MSLLASESNKAVENFIPSNFAIRSSVSSILADATEISLLSMNSFEVVSFGCPEKKAATIIFSFSSLSFLSAFGLRLTSILNGGITNESSI
jgi:hypothetical protein